MEALTACMNAIVGFGGLLVLLCHRDVLRVRPVYRLSVWLACVGLLGQAYFYFTEGSLAREDQQQLMVWILTSSGYWVAGIAFALSSWTKNSRFSFLVPSTRSRG